jgi:ADP-ribosylglycohydrolase/protein-tyrosine phosphatase
LAATHQAQLPLRLTGAVWGHLVGDAMGVPYEFREPEEIGDVRFGERGTPERPATHGQPPGTWSDDGALMLALLDSLVSVGFDPEDQGRRALAWFQSGAYTPDGTVFDWGGTTTAALRAIERGTPAEEAGPTGEHSQSNGSLMRILPIALWGHGRPRAELVELAVRASGVTHGHPIPKATCAVYLLVADGLLAGQRPSEALRKAEVDVRAALAALAASGSEDLVRAADDVWAWRTNHRPEGRGGALNAFWSAWEAVTRSRSYRGTIERAIRFGHDTDTTAAIAGGLAGIRWGIDGIPADWLAGLRGHEVVGPLVDRLLEARGWRTSTRRPLRVDWVDLSAVPGLRDAPGRLGMTILPGKQYVGWHGPAWRDLEVDVARLREVHGCDVFLLLVEDQELVDTRTTAIVEAFERHGIELVRHPVVDMSVPSDEKAFRTTLEAMSAALRAGKSVVVACRGGLGRTGTAVACMLVDAGLAPDRAIALTRATRKETIERDSQVELVRRWPAVRRARQARKGTAPVKPY